MKNKVFLHLLALAFLLAVFWWTNSGYFKPLLLGLGFLSVFGVLGITAVMDKKDEESFPALMPSWRLPGYLLWMIGQIFKSNIDVLVHIVKGPSSISPTIVQVQAGQKSEVARVLYANSITMTPGTVTLLVNGDLLEVHALTREAAESLKEGEMNRRVSRLEGL